MSNSEKIGKLWKKSKLTNVSSAFSIFYNYSTDFFFHIFHIFSLFNLFFFHTFQILSLFNLIFFHIFPIFSPFNLFFFRILQILSLFNLIFFHIFHIFSLFNLLCFCIFQIKETSSSSSLPPSSFSASLYACIYIVFQNWEESSSNSFLLDYGSRDQMYHLALRKTTVRTRTWSTTQREEEEEVSLGVIMTNTEIIHIFQIFSHFSLLFFHNFHIFSLFNLLFFHIFQIISLFNLFFENEIIYNVMHYKSRLNSEKIWKIQKKSKLNSEKIWKLWKKNRLNSEMIGTFLP
jgi:hypothetical protein